MAIKTPYLIEENHKNYVHNGNFDVWQRGTSYTFASNGYFFERWYHGSTGAVQFSRQSATPPQGSLYYARLLFSTAGMNTNDFYYMEDFDVAPLKGKTVTFSMLVRRSGTPGGIRLRAFKNSTPNTRLGGSWTQIATKSWLDSEIPTVDGTNSDWQRIYVTFDVPNDGTANGLRLNYVNDANSAGTNSYLEIAQIQLNIGAEPAPFSRYSGSASGELEICQRYYEFMSLYNNYWRFFAGSVTVYREARNFAVTKRAFPSVTLEGTMSYQNANSFGVDGANVSAVSVTVTAASASIAEAYSTDPNCGLKISADF